MPRDIARTVAGTAAAGMTAIGTGATRPGGGDMTKDGTGRQETAVAKPCGSETLTAVVAAVVSSSLAKIIDSVKTRREIGARNGVSYKL